MERQSAEQVLIREKGKVCDILINNKAEMKFEDVERSNRRHPGGNQQRETQEGSLSSSTSSSGQLPQSQKGGYIARIVRERKVRGHGRPKKESEKKVPTFIEVQTSNSQPRHSKRIRGGTIQA